ncbi:disease resistance protein RML1A-like [Quercus suber]|uniref:disease resistance protein RML1A-like n=1 Tax=Quercus suber TaxID=58331 RepID=UPI000CE1E330|nr:disease resistance protein RML1A-like isoform X2 [Quercus suber]
MSNLRLMIIGETDYHYPPTHLAVPNNQRQLFVPNQLRHLSWAYCPLKCLSSSSQPKELVRLDLSRSRIEYLWEGVMRSVTLKFINLCGSKNLIRTPDFSGVPMLEGLDLSCCDSLVEIHPSIGQLSKLRYLLLEECESLTDLPCMSAIMQSLSKLRLPCCPKFSSFPKFTGIMKSLSELNLSMTAIKKVPPSSINCLTALTFLDLSGTDLECLPSNMDNLRSLQTLRLTFCCKLKLLPRLPSTIRCIEMKCCNSLKWLPARVKLSIWFQFLSLWLPYDERFNRKEFTILFHFLQVQGLLCCKTIYGTSSKGKEDGSITEFLIIMPSCLTEIVESSISIELPSNWYNSKWIGLALWALVPNPESTYGLRDREVAVGKMPQNHCAFELFTTRINVEVKTERHLNNYLLYLSRDEWFATVGDGEYSQIKVIFKGGKLYETEFGVSLVYEQDVDEFNQTNAQCLFASFGEVPIYKLTVGDDDDDGDDDGDDDEDGLY